VLKKPASIKILAAFAVFWSLFNVILSFTQISNSCTLASSGSSGSACDAIGIKVLCGTGSDAVPFSISSKMTDGSSAGDLFCGWPIGLTANRLFAGFLNVAFSSLHLVNLATGRFLLAKTSAHIVYLLFGAWWFANMCSDANSVIKGQSACIEKRGLISLSSTTLTFNCVNPFYSPPLCDIACSLFLFSAGAACWLGKDTDSAPKPQPATSYQDSHTPAAPAAVAGAGTTTFNREI